MFGLHTLFAPAMIAALVPIVIVAALTHGAIGFGLPLRPAVSGPVFGTGAGLFSGVNVSAPPLVIYFPRRKRSPQTDVIS